MELTARKVFLLCNFLSHILYLAIPKINEKGYKRLSPDQSVGLRHAGYLIAVQEVIKVETRASLFEKFCTVSK